MTGDSEMATSDVIDTLNDLIETCKDGENGFRECADNVKSESLKTLFDTYARHCAQSAAELQSEVRRLGGDPERTGSVSASLHRGWIDIKSALTGKDDDAVIAECERGEDVAMQSYQKALQANLPAEVRALVERQYSGVREHHDRVRALKSRF
jgi:uncharacterized protein (TIGR02284 family)